LGHASTGATSAAEKTGGPPSLEGPECTPASAAAAKSSEAAKARRRKKVNLMFIPDSIGSSVRDR
jgi:hypothetical protein